MKITVFGANGRVGRLVVAEALDSGHSVTAFVHGSNPFEQNNNLQVIQGDIYKIEDVENALKGSDCVISTLGSWGTPKKDILSEGMKNIIPAMQELGVKRIVTLTGAGCNPAGTKTSIVDKLNRLPPQLIAPKVLKDAEIHMQLLKNSELDWTILKSPIMNNYGNEMSYEIVNSCPMPWATINRLSVAKAMVDLINSNEHKRQTPSIKRV